MQRALGVFSISIHALLAESDALRSPRIALMVDFYPRSPCGERLQRQIEFERYSDISIHALLAESDRGEGVGLANIYISIHALLAESDGTEHHPYPLDAISIHALLAESDRMLWAVQAFRVSFLSTLSLRRATHCHPRCRYFRNDFYPRSPCGERPSSVMPPPPMSHFYPRSPCGERRGGPRI